MVKYKNGDKMKCFLHFVSNMNFLLHFFTFLYLKIVKGKLVRNIVYPSQRPGIAPQYPPHRQYSTFYEAVLFVCLKEKSAEKIYGAVAMIMALDRAIRNGNIISESVYDERGILLL